MTFLLFLWALAASGYIVGLKFKERYTPPPKLLTNDEEIINYLAASAEISPLANRLLNQVADKTLPDAVTQAAERLLAAPKPEPKPPQWHHSTSQSTPCEALWKICLEDIQKEESDSFRLKAVEYWDQAQTFTTYERAELLKLFKSAVYRNAAREILLRDKNKPKEKGDKRPPAEARAARERDGA